MTQARRPGPRRAAPMYTRRGSPAVQRRGTPAAGLSGLEDMLEGVSFHSFMTRVRAGDEAAARELVERFEKVIRREVRLRLYDLRMQRLFDSMDISQSVLTSFFTRASTGQFDLESPEQLVRLLVRMARNKLA